uniref:Major facilitator superfamily (MFS) profile domain-containing protein n=1 Tax=Cuerna arida TaxID=1464854 RepID=A0A1B6G9Z8_9HEMI
MSEQSLISDPAPNMRFSFPGSRGNLYYSVFAADLASAAAGTHFSWSSPTLPKLEAADSWLPINAEQASWIGSLTALGTVFGPFLGSWLVNTIGRRWAIVTSVMICFVAWIILLFANSVWIIYIGRFIGGAGGGIAFLACPMYVAEISEPEVRGALGSLFAFFLVAGYLIEYAFGPYVSYSVLIFLNFIPTVLFLLCISLTPESPYYFLREGETSKALESLTWLRKGRRPEEIQKELSEIETEVRRSMAEKVGISDLVATVGNRRGLVISLGVVAGQQISGVNVDLFYAQNIFIMAGSSFSSSASTLIVGVILFVAGGFAPPLARIFGMKNVLLLSAIGMAIFQFVLGMYFYLSSTGYDMTAYGWLPVTSMVLFILTYTVGYGPLPWAVMAEMFPTNVKALASAITASFCWFIAFLLTKFFNIVSELLGTYFPFFLFCGLCVLTAIFTIFVVPDTRGMTMQEILDPDPDW